MEQIAHQALVMQFIIEMARSCNVDPRGCFRLFFQKTRVSQNLYITEKNSYTLTKDQCSEGGWRLNMLLTESNL